MQVALDRRQRDVHDGVVEHDHEQREAHRSERPPLAVVVGDQVPVAGHRPAFLSRSRRSRRSRALRAARREPPRACAARSPLSAGGELLEPGEASGDDPVGELLPFAVSADAADPAVVGVLDPGGEPLLTRPSTARLAEAAEIPSSSAISVTVRLVLLGCRRARPGPSSGTKVRPLSSITRNTSLLSLLMQRSTTERRAAAPARRSVRLLVRSSRRFVAASIEKRLAACNLFASATDVRWVTQARRGES